MPNNNLILSTKTLNLPFFPPLSAGKSNRVVTKLFTNLSLYLPQDQFGMLAWLIYQAEGDNSFIYTTHLLNKYSAAVKACSEVYKPSPLSSDLKRIRAVFKRLIQSGYILPTSSRKRFIINPMLSYSGSFKDYIRAVEGYQELKAESASEFADKYMDLARKK
jgi:hypothetical protein